MKIPTAFRSHCLLGMTIFISFAIDVHRLYGQANNSYLSAGGSHTVVLQPTKVRLRVKAMTQSRSAKGALEYMTEHQKKAKAELAEAGAISESIVFSTPTISEGIPGLANPEAAKRTLRSQRMMQMQMLPPNARGKMKVDEEIELPQLFNCNSVMIADWNVDPSDVSQLTLLPSDIKSKVVENDWIGSSRRVELEADEQAAVDSLSGMIQSYVTYSSPFDSHTPDIAIVFLAVVTQEQMDEATKLATQAARRRLKLGKELLAPNPLGMTWIDNSYYDAQSSRVPSSLLPSTGESVSWAVRNKMEVAAISPDELKKEVAVTLTAHSSTEITDNEAPK
jgi:hypothetical protein